MNPLMKYLLSNVARLPEGEGGSDTSTQTTDTSAPAAESGEAAFKFDPETFFVPPAKEGSGEDGGEGSATDDQSGAETKDGAQVASTKAPSTPTPPAPDPAKEGGGDDPLAALRASVQAFLTKPATPAEASPQPAKAASQPEPAKAGAETPAETKPRYDFTVPDEVVDALGAEEPAVRKRAVNALMSGLANKLAQDFGSALAAVAQHAEEQAVQKVMAQIQQEEGVRTVRQDFYDTHKDLKVLADNLPPFDGMVWQVAQQVVQATGKKGYDPEVRDQTAAIIKLQLGLVKPGETSTPAPAANGGRQPRPGQFSAGGSSSRPNGAAEGNEFMAVVNAT